MKFVTILLVSKVFEENLLQSVLVIILLPLHIEHLQMLIRILISAIVRILSISEFENGEMAYSSGHSICFYIKKFNV